MFSMHAVVFCVAIQLIVKNSWLNSRLCVLVFMCVNIIVIHMVLIQYNFGQYRIIFTIAYEMHNLSRQLTLATAL